MNRLQSICRARRATACRSTRATGSDPRTGPGRRSDEPPDVHLPDARRAAAAAPRCRATAARATPAPTSATASTRTAAGPASRSPRRWSADAAWSSRRMRLAPARGQGPASARAPVHLRARARRLLLRARPRRARRGCRAAAARRAATGANVVAFRDADHLATPADGPATRTSARTCAPSGDDPAGWRITLVTNLRVLGYVFNPASFLPVPR